MLSAGVRLGALASFFLNVPFHDYNTISNSILKSTVYLIVVQTLRSSRPFFKGLSFLIHLTRRSSTLDPFPVLRKNWGKIINYFLYFL